jgi:nitric oxide reductase subunit C
MTSKIFLVLLASYLFYSVYVYINCDNRDEGVPGKHVNNGFAIWQEKNCQSCHQIYGLGGYMGPDLTNISSEPAKGVAYAKAFIKYGSAKMPNFQLHEDQVDDLIAFLKWVDKSGTSKVPANKVTATGNYDIKNVE